MKSLSAAAIIAAGLYAVVHAAPLRSDTGTFLIWAGIVTSVLGFVGWFKVLQQP